METAMSTRQVHHKELLTEQAWNYTMMWPGRAQNNDIGLIHMGPDKLHLVTPMRFLEFIAFHVKTSAILIQLKRFYKIFRRARTFVVIART
jgi:hypothetical protein